MRIMLPARSPCRLCVAISKHARLGTNVSTGVYAGCTTFPTPATQQQQPPQSQATTTSKVKKRQSATGDLVPKIVDAYPYYIGLDTAALEKNLTALGYLP